VNKARFVSSLISSVLLWSPLAGAADLSTYRGFPFGMGLSAAVQHSGVEASEVTTIQQRPARLQELNWRPGRFSTAVVDTDPVEKVVFRFYNGQLFRMVVDYDSQKTEGLRAEDLIQAISLRYGTATRPAGEVLLPSAVFSQGVTVLARWEDADYSFTLVHSPYGSSFGLIGFSKRLDGLAQAAIASGTQLDEQEAPQRQKAKEQDALRQEQKARLVNQGHFRP
jgi:hypothetical protein